MSWNVDSSGLPERSHVSRPTALVLAVLVAVGVLVVPTAAGSGDRSAAAGVDGRLGLVRRP